MTVVTGDLTDRAVLRLIAENGDLLHVDGRVWLLVPIGEPVETYLCTLDCDLDDLEPDGWPEEAGGHGT